jgi:hypothetical protein
MRRFQEKRMRWWAWLAVLLSFGKVCIAGDVQTFSHIKIRRHRSPENRVLVDKVGTLTFDNANRKLTFEKPPDDKFDEAIKIEVGYDAVTKVVFETTMHMRAGGFAQVLTAVPTVGIAGPVIAAQHVQDYWFFLEYKDGEPTRQALFEVPKSSSPAVIDTANRLFGSRVVLSDFSEKGQSIDPDKLPDHKSKHSVRIDKTNRPVPEIKPDKATIVVVCPPLAARDSGRGNQFKLHANDRVIAVNRAGTYSFAYLDPGKYELVSQSENANGFEMDLKAGETYYFLQNTFAGVFKLETALSRNSPELVNYLMSGTDYSDWSRKDGQ